MRDFDKKIQSTSEKRLKILGLAAIIGILFLQGLCLLAGPQIFLQCNTLVILALLPIMLGTYIVYKFFWEKHKIGMFVWSLSISIAVLSTSFIGMLFDPDTDITQWKYDLLIAIIFGIIAFAFSYFVMFFYSPIFKILGDFQQRKK